MQESIYCLVSSTAYICSIVTFALESFATYSDEKIPFNAPKVSFSSLVFSRTLDFTIAGYSRFWITKSKQ